MKKFKKVFAVLLLMLLIAAPVVTAATQPVTVEAAARTKTKLKKVKGKYYAYENGKKVCNKWRTIKVGKKKYRFYFDKKGRAYQANKAAMGKTGVLVKKSRVNIMDLTIRDIWSKAFVVEVLLHIVCLICISLIQKVYTTRKNCNVQKRSQNQQQCNSDQETSRQIQKGICYR